jgi:hypothetical protein
MVLRLIWQNPKPNDTRRVQIMKKNLVVIKRNEGQRGIIEVGMIETGMIETGMIETGVDLNRMLLDDFRLFD